MLATATAAPNDFIELGTSSEALGDLGYTDMLGKFFVNDQNNIATNRRGRFTDATKWRLKGHAELAFWRWVTSWARAARRPSDLGFSDDGYQLPELIEKLAEGGFTLYRVGQNIEPINVLELLKTVKGNDPATLLCIKNGNKIIFQP